MAAPEPEVSQPEASPDARRPARLTWPRPGTHPTVTATGRRPPASSPEAMAAARGGAVEGLAWLGRPPEARASLLYRILRLVARFVLLRRVPIPDPDRRPGEPAGGGYFLVAAAHRGWMDPFVVMHALPAEPRAWFLGSAPSTFTSRWRERLIHRLGGLLPVWRGGVGVEAHVASARAVVANGAVFVQMPEGTVSGPAGRIGTFRNGWAIIALRTEAPIVPLAMAGTEELYLGRRLASRVLPATTARALAGLGPGEPLPDAGSRDELDDRPSDEYGPGRDPRTGRGGAASVDRRPAGPPEAHASPIDVAPAPAGSYRPGRLTGRRCDCASESSHRHCDARSCDGWWPRTSRSPSSSGRPGSPSSSTHTTVAGRPKPD